MSPLTCGLSPRADIDLRPMRRWYVVRTKPHQELLAQKNLEHQGYHTYLPLCMEQRQRRQRFVKTVAPLFPGYLFSRIDTTVQTTAPIRSTFGTMGMLRFGDRIAVVPDLIIADLQDRTDRDTGLVCPRQAQFSRGDKVAVASGPFVGLEGIYQSQSGGDRVRILLNMLGRQTATILSRTELRPRNIRTHVACSTE